MKRILLTLILVLCTATYVSAQATNQAPGTVNATVDTTDLEALFGATPAAAADNTANPTFGSIGSFLFGFEGTTWDRITSTSGSLNVNITGGSSAGTQYTEGDTDATIVGTALLFEGAGNALVAAPGTAADGLLVNLGANNDVTVTGTVTANAGTNLNTSALALESGGNLAAAATSLATLDNAISGNEMQVDCVSGCSGGTPVDDDGSVPGGTSVPTQIAFLHYWTGSAWARASQAAGGSGTIDSDTTRVTIATDDIVNDAMVELAAAISTEVQVDIVGALPAGTNNIGDVDVLSIAAGDNNIGNVDIASAIPAGTNTIGGVTPVAATSGGADAYTHISAGSTEDEHAVKATAGTLYSITTTNTNAAVRYLKCENDTAANTAPGTDTPELRIAIPGATTGAGFTTSFPTGWSFSTALTCWLVTGAADSDVAEVAANEIMVFYTYK
jgi:hypothetical protein